MKVQILFSLFFTVKNPISICSFYLVRMIFSKNCSITPPLKYESPTHLSETMLGQEICNLIFTLKGWPELEETSACYNCLVKYEI